MFVESAAGGYSCVPAVFVHVWAKIPGAQGTLCWTLIAYSNGEWVRCGLCHITLATCSRNVKILCISFVRIHRSFDCCDVAVFYAYLRSGSREQTWHAYVKIRADHFSVGRPRGKVINVYQEHGCAVQHSSSRVFCTLCTVHCAMYMYVFGQSSLIATLRLLVLAPSFYQMHGRPDQLYVSKRTSCGFRICRLYCCYCPQFCIRSCVVSRFLAKFNVQSQPVPLSRYKRHARTHTPINVVFSPYFITVTVSCVSCGVFFLWA